jgi:hypothetical protein
MVPRVEASEKLEGLPAGWPMPPRQWRGKRRFARSRARAEQGCEGCEQERPGRLDRGRDERLGRNDLEPGREVEPPVVSRFGDELVEHEDA